MDRRGFLATAGALAARLMARAGASPRKGARMRMPVLFVGHGSPMNAIEDSVWARGWEALGAGLPRPRAILSVSAHWYLPGTFLTDGARPETIHDFGGFPRALFEVQYPAAGEPDLAKRVVKLLSGRAALRGDWGLDHGTWSVLRRMRPEADIPVVQLSIDARLPPGGHLELGRALRPLRDEGVLVLGSGNVTHNLRLALRSLQSGDKVVPPWASAFDGDVARAVEQRDGAFLAKLVESDNGRMAHPTIDHYLPLLYAVGAADERDQVGFPVSGFEASLSMRSILFDSTAA